MGHIYRRSCSSQVSSISYVLCQLYSLGDIQKIESRWTRSLACAMGHCDDRVLSQKRPSIWTPYYLLSIVSAHLFHSKFQTMNRKRLPNLCLVTAVNIYIYIYIYMYNTLQSVVNMMVTWPSGYGASFRISTEIERQLENVY